jgi:uncharacterized alkaline shock family protein YloU
MSAYPSSGKTTLTPDVIMTIARMTALEVEGVKGMAPIKGGVKRLLGRGTEGVQVEVEDNLVMLDLHIIVSQDVNIREVGRELQERVARAIAEMTGLEVGHVNIHIEDIDYGVEEG